MSMKLIPLAGAIVVLAAAPQVQAQTAPAADMPPVAPSVPTSGEAVTSTTPPAPAIQAGAPVLDRDGVRVGAVQTLVESPAGPMVVARIDGKLITLPQAGLKLDGANVVSTQTKAQMLGAAGAPQ